ncbi:GH1 family beta-glucosidase [Tessaracoccus oleiagri]|uniref:Beta-glucosidase n=1 Tax=Tessaracoccus oleiagri TaxID=686624 RepID=A0A1G9H7M5_9ACTN|nr:GH1 family beta-glucosidase [Tessaracoccus oleiagri]SDL08859.1 beta-glucosidase [Tessaracoccus oleiagri]
MTIHRFPQDFLWGSATAAFQIEGAALEDGRRDSIWDTFCRVPGAIVNGDDGSVACDHYHRMPQDVALMKELGLQVYRFSSSWARVRPDDREFNPAGLDFYSRLVDELLGAGIRPWITLYHWDLPAAIPGGWTNRDTAHRFVEYAEKMAETLGDRVQDWTTLNEPWCSSLLSYAGGEHAPGHTDPREAVAAVHHLHLAHGLATRRLREVLPDDASVGLTLNFTVADPVDPDSPTDREAARRIDGLQNRLFLDPIFRGAYPDDVLADLNGLGLESHIRDGDLETISTPIDWLGVNYYNGAAVTGSPDNGPAPSPEANGRRVGNPNIGSEWVEFVPRGLPVTDMGWEIQPDGLRRLLERLHVEYTGPADIGMYVTENGCAMPDRADEDGFVDDQDRIGYLRGHFIAVEEAIAQGADVRGYFVWSLLDNFEWAWGYDKRFGIVRVDYETLERTPKASALFYRDVIAANAVEEE